MYGFHTSSKLFLRLDSAHRDPMHISCIPTKRGPSSVFLISHDITAIKTKRTFFTNVNFSSSWLDVRFCFGRRSKCPLSSDESCEYLFFVIGNDHIMRVKATRMRQSPAISLCTLLLRANFETHASFSFIVRGVCLVYVCCCLDLNMGTVNARPCSGALILI